MNILIINESLLWAIFVVGCIWLLVNYVAIPISARKLRVSSAKEAPYRAGMLSVLAILALIMGAATAAGTIILLFGLSLDLWLSSLSSSVDSLSTVVSIRDFIEQQLDALAQFSQGIWLVTITAIGMSWLWVSRSSSIKRWSTAIQERRSALRKSLEGSSSDTLRQEVESKEPDKLKALESRVKDLEKANKALIGSAEKKPVVQLNEHPDSLASLADLRKMESSIREQINVGQDDFSGGESTSATQPSDENRQSSLAGADALSQLIKDIERDLTVSFSRLDGSKRSVPLLVASEQYSINQEEINAELVEIIVELRVKDHDKVAGSKVQKEPELFREWMATIPTSEASVYTASKVGHYSARIALVSMFLGLVGLELAV